MKIKQAQKPERGVAPRVRAGPWPCSPSPWPESFLSSCFCSVFLCLMAVDPDAIWFFLCNVWCPRNPEAPHPCLRPVKLAGSEKTRNEFTDNVQSLLDQLGG